MWSGETWKKNHDLILLCVDPELHRIPNQQRKVTEVDILSRAPGTDPGGCCQQIRVSSNDIGQVQTLRILFVLPPR